MKRLILLIAVISVLAISAFSQAGQIGVRQWTLVQLNGETILHSPAYLELNAGQTRFSGSAGCNRMFGAVYVRRDRVDFSSIGTTRRACADRRAQRLETDFVRTLENVDRFERRGNVLQLYVRRSIVMRLTAQMKKAAGYPPGRVRLEDKKWTLEGISGVSISRLGRAAFIVFDRAKGSAGGNSSCNVFGGSYTNAGSTLKITEVISTMRACIEDERMKIERDFLDGLRTTNRYEINNGKLMLYENKRLLLTLNGEAK